MNMQACVFILLASVLFAALKIQTVDSADFDYCYNFAEYHTLIDLTRHDKCMNIDSVFKLLADLTTKQGSGSCRIHAIAVLSAHIEQEGPMSNHFGSSHAGTPDHCHCGGVNTLQQYHMGFGDGVSDQRRHCHHSDPNYRHLYDEFFVNDQHTSPPACRTHHSLWNTLKSTHTQDLGDGNSCQKDIIFHLRYAFEKHTDKCTCSEVATHQTTGQQPHQSENCHHLDSFNKLMQLGNSDGCLSANSVWHYLDDLQVKNPECRKRVQSHLAQKYHNAQSQTADDCVCNERRALVNHEIHRMSNASYFPCRYHANGGTYNDITYDLFDNIKNTGCLNHNYLWQKLQGIHDYQQVDCTQDLIVRAAIQYSTDESDPCVCSKEKCSHTNTAAAPNQRNRTYHPYPPKKDTPSMPILSPTMTDTLHVTMTSSSTTTTTATTTIHPTTPPNGMATVHQTNGQNGHHTDDCHHLDSFNKLMQLQDTDGCLSANSVWHYLDDLQVKSPECRVRIQKHLDEKYHNAQSQDADGCVCRERSPLVNHRIHTMSNGSYQDCRFRTSGTYRDITHDLFDNIQTSGCLNHNYLWNKLQGIHNHHHTDCTQDLIVRAAIQYPTDESDPCVCSQVSYVTTTASHTTTPAAIATDTTLQTTTTVLNVTKTVNQATTPEAITTEDTTLQTSTTGTLPPASATSLKVTYTSTTKAAPTHPVMQKFSCDKLTTIENMVKSVHLVHPNSSPCDPSGQGSDDAYILSVCNMTLPTTWRKGANVMSDCESATPVIQTYTPISTFNGDNYNPLGAQSGVFLGCLTNGIKMAVQKCNGVPEIIHVEAGSFVNNPRSYYVIV